MVDFLKKLSYIGYKDPRKTPARMLPSHSLPVVFLGFLHFLR